MSNKWVTKVPGSPVRTPRPPVWHLLQGKVGTRGYGLPLVPESAPVRGWRQPPHQGRAYAADAFFSRYPP